MTAAEKARACIAGLNPATLDYDTWLKVGMAMRHSGCTLAEFDAWSRADTRYNERDVAAKWKSFKGGGARAVTIAGLIAITREHGRLDESVFDRIDDDPGHGFGFEDLVPRPGNHPVRPEWVDPVAEEDIPAPPLDFGSAELGRYIALMFQPEETVCYCIKAFERPEKPGKFMPTKGVHEKAGKLLELIRRNPQDITNVIATPDAVAGAWIRINPMDGNGVSDSNVTAFRHALLEADEGEIGHQLATIREMKVPVSCIVHSGGKSVHALVRVDAADYDEYRSRVDYLFKVAAAAGLKVDPGNRNPSRYSRMPGVSRDGRPQYILQGKGGMADWQAWVDWTEDAHDDLPAIQTLAESLGKNLPPLPDEVIGGLLRRTEKLVLAGPSGAGKSFALDQLAIAIAEGGNWLGFNCPQGRPLYINAELHAASCIRRFAAIYDAMGLAPKNAGNIELWNLRGAVRALDRLQSKIIRRVTGRQVSCIILDPIYKFYSGDENDAGDMGAFVNLIDKIGNDLGVAVVYAHHHAKGAQGARKAMDRASGSGVIARDADAMIDLVGLVLDEMRRKTLVEQVLLQALDGCIARIDPDGNRVPDDERAPGMYLAAAQRCYPRHGDALHATAQDAHRRGNLMTGWRVEVGKVRDYAKPPIRDVWFDFPLHVPDRFDLLMDAQPDDGQTRRPQNRTDKAHAERSRMQKTDEAQDDLEEAVDACGGPVEATVKAVAEHSAKTEEAIRKRLKKSKKYDFKNGLIVLRKSNP